MPSTATPPPPPPPPAVAYPPPPPPAAVATPAAPPAGGHGHLNGAKIGAIAGGGVALIGGIVALITLLGHHDPVKPPPTPAPVQPVNNQPTTPPSTPPSAPPSQPTPESSQPSSPQPESPTPESSEPPSNSGGSGIDLGNGASVKPAAGWKVQGTGHNQVALLGPNSDAEYFAIGGAAKEQTAAAQLQDDAQSFVSSDSALSGVKVGDAQTQSVSGSAGFTSVATMPFTATLTTNQGTAQIIGLFYELLNPQGYSVLVVFDATSEDAYKAAAPDSDSMTSSILG